MKRRKRKGEKPLVHVIYFVEKNEVSAGADRPKQKQKKQDPCARKYDYTSINIFLNS
jgi:hypothetical protein